MFNLTDFTVASSVHIGKSLRALNRSGWLPICASLPEPYIIPGGKYAGNFATTRAESA